MTTTPPISAIEAPESAAADAVKPGVAVVGISCRFPSVDGTAEFWRLLIEGRTTVGRYPQQRTTASVYPDHPDVDTLAAGSFFDTVDGFDSEFFDLSDDEAVATDPVARLGLELGWEVVEDARISASTLAGRKIDVVVGAAPSGYHDLRRAQGCDRDDHYSALGSSGALVANRISSLLDLRGLSLCADAGQSSTLVALTLASERIQSGVSDGAIVGGVNLVAFPETGLGLANLGALSPDGRCFTFDDRANGFVRGEGGAFVLLKPLDQALEDKDRIYSVIRGWSVGNGGATSRIPNPSPSAQAATIQAALNHAGLKSEDLGYIEAHGTGTRVGDPAELIGLRSVLLGRGRPLAIGSVKTNVGHLENAAGIVGFVKAALSVHHGQIVPSLNFNTPNPAVSDFHQNFEVPGSVKLWPDNAVRRAGISAFGLGGTNAHVVIEQAPAAQSAAGGNVLGDSGVKFLPWVLSARSDQALRDGAARLEKWIRKLSDDSRCVPPKIESVAYSLATTRQALEYRAVVVGDKSPSLLAGLNAIAAGDVSADVVRGVSAGPEGSVAFVFPGQGSQWVGMGARMYAESPVFAHSIRKCSDALAPWIEWSLVDVITAHPEAPSLDRVDVVQPALFAMMVSLSNVWRSLGIEPAAVIGHSQGEIAAACVAGAVTLEDAARLVALRSRALTMITGLGGMVAVAAPLKWVQERLSGWSSALSIAAVNGPESVVVSGDTGALDQFAKFADGEGVRVRRIQVDYASHSHQIERIHDQVIAATLEVSAKKSSVDFYSTVTAELIDTRSLQGGYWYENLRSTVRFAEVVNKLIDSGIRAFVEVSPHPVLGAALEDAATELQTPPTVVSTLQRSDGGMQAVVTSLARIYAGGGVKIDWMTLFEASRPEVIDLPRYSFQRKSHWLSVADNTVSDRPGKPVVGDQLSTEREVLELVYSHTALLLGNLTDRQVAAELRGRPTVTFKELGMDSAMAVRLRNQLTVATGARLSATVAFSYPTPSALSRHIFSLIALRPDREASGDSTVAMSSPAVKSTGLTLSTGEDDELYELIDRGYVERHPSDSKGAV